MPGIRLACHKCGRQQLKWTSYEAFELQMAAPQGYKCDSCGTPRMSHMKTNRQIKDGFEPGWQENIRQWAWSRQSYNRLLRQAGLDEIGYDYVPQESTRNDASILATPEMAQEIARLDPTMSGQELDAIESGEYFKDAKYIESEE